jgi:predicted alpha/beta-fold hydrolase
MEPDRQPEQSRAHPPDGKLTQDLADFIPARYARNAHAQAVLASFWLRKPLVLRRARDLLRDSRPQVLDCGAGVRLQGYFAAGRGAGPDPRRLAVLIHGWEGSADSLYLISAAANLQARGYDVFRLNLRDHGATHGLNVELFHSCRLDEVVGAVRRLAANHPRHRLHLAGFSLGGNFALRVAARAGRAGLEVASVAAICPVLDPAHTLEALEKGWFGYRLYFLRRWRRSLRLKQASHPGVYDFRELLALPTLTGMTDYLVRHHSEFADLGSYLEGYAIVDGALRELDVPSRVFVAADDPIIPFADVERLAAPPCLTVEATDFGGHCGYLQGPGLSSWIDEKVCQALDV